MDEFKRRVDELASLMEEFHLKEAKLEGDGWKVAFRSRGEEAPNPSIGAQDSNSSGLAAPNQAPLETPIEHLGEPLTSPMNGIYYSQPSPSAPSFVAEGDEVEEGQVVALIEAMKVFNEIIAPFDGTVTKIIAHNTQLVQSGEPLMYILASE